VSQDRPIARGPLTLSVMLAATMYTLDGTIANVALPHMQGSLSAGLDQITWVLTSFIVAQALMTPLVGWVSERIGRKALMVASIIGFTLASLACGLAPNLPAMITFRIIQGICGASFIPLSQSILFDINPPERHPQAMATFGAGVVLGPVMGPALGGWITEQFGWHWVFLINLPVGIVALLGVLRYLPERRSDTPRPFDFTGFGALALFITALQLMLDRGPGEGWFESWEVIIEAAMAVIGIYIFAVHTITAERPFFSRALLKNWNFTAGLVLSLATGTLMYSSLALLPPMMQNILGYPVITVGLVTMPRGAGMLVSMMIGGRLIGRIDPRAFLITGFLTNAFAMWMMSMSSPQMDSHIIMQSGLLQGCGLGMIFVSSNTLAFGTLPPELRTDASSVITLARSLGSAVGISLMQAMFMRNLQTTYTVLVPNIRTDNPVFQNQMGSMIDLGSIQGLSTIAAEVGRQAAMVSYVNDFYLSMVLTIGTIPLIFFLKPPSAGAGGGGHALPD